MTFVHSYFPSYYSIEDIMVTQETVPCVLEVPLRRLGFLIPGNDKEDIDCNTQLELPFWLAHELIPDARRRAAIVTIQMPKVFNDRNRDIFEADAKVVNLYRVNSHFYEFGRLLACLNHREADLVKSLIIKAFKERFRLVMDWADNVMTEPRKVQMLETSERGLLRLGHRARALLDAWLVNGVAQMQPAELVLNLRKRKLMDES